MIDLITQIVAFVIMVFVIYRYVVPLVSKLIRDRQDVVQRQVEEAEKATRELEEANARLDASVEQARQEAARIRDDARADATRIREELVAQAEQDVARIKQRGRDQLSAQRDQVVRGLRSEVGNTSFELAERVVHESLGNDAARSATVDGFLTDIEGLPARSPVTAGGA